MLEPCAEEIWVVGDAARLSQSIANVLANAAKFTEPGGRVGVRIDRDSTQASVRIKDNGIGIPESLLPRVFDVFTQGDRSLDRSQGGLGLGLSLVKRLVELQGGTVSAASEGSGYGSEFVIRLPIATPPDARQPSPVRALRTTGPRRILVVDDNRDAAESTADLLRRERHEVKTAYSGAAALGVARGRSEHMSQNHGRAS